MSDIVCAACGVPKPSVCFEHSGAHRDTCQPCVTRMTANRAAAWKRSAKGRTSYAISKRRRIQANPDLYAAQVAESFERRGL